MNTWIYFLIIGISMAGNIVLAVLYGHSRYVYRRLMDKNLAREKQKKELVDSLSFNLSELKDEQEKKLLSEMQRSMERDRLYLNPDLSLQDFAKALGTSKSTLSHVINTSLNRNYASFLNYYRIREAVQVLSNPDYFNYKIEAVGEMCGFGSRQVFHAAFKRELGITPTHFRNINKTKDLRKERLEKRSNRNNNKAPLAFLCALLFLAGVPDQGFAMQVVRCVEGVDAEVTLNRSSLDRLDSMHVIHYDLTVDLTDFSGRQLSGTALLWVQVKSETLSRLRLDLKLSADSVFVDGVRASFVQQGDSLWISTPGAVANDTLEVKVHYHGHPVTDARWGGFYYSGQYAYNMGVAFQEVPHSYGRSWFPCVDDFRDKSSVAMHVRTQPGKIAVCGGLLTDSARLSDGNRIWSWELSKPVPVYLFSVAVGPYQLYADTFQGKEAVIPIEIYSQPAEAPNVEASFAHLKDILRMYERLFGPYRWPRVGYVAVDFTSGAMEHACNIAYPKAAIDGTERQAGLYGHELFHHWFGNLVTCQKAEEMWINEGFAAYAESLVAALLGGDSGYAEHIRDLHRSTLMNILEKDGHHYALDSVPLAYTYGRHSYDKGALIVHTLRHYMGDSLFFGGMSAMLEQYACKNIGSRTLFETLSRQTGMDLLPFYEAWVHQPGFLHFSIDSVKRTDHAGRYRVYLHQKLWGAEWFAMNNRMDVAFVSSQRKWHVVEGLSFSGEFDSVEVEIPFDPMACLTDPKGKMATARVEDHFSTIGSAAVSLGESYCNLQVQDCADSVWICVEHNLVAPDKPVKLPEGLHRMSETHYWRVQLAYDKEKQTEPQGYLQFRFLSASASQYDYDLFQDGYRAANLKLLYRPDASAPWEIVPTVRSGSNLMGALKTSFVRSGDYCFAVGEEKASVHESSDAEPCVYPNPSRELLCVEVNESFANRRAQLVDMSGRVVKVFRLKAGCNRIELNSLPAAPYLLRVFGKNEVFTKNIIKY